MDLSLGSKGENHRVTLCHYGMEVWNHSHAGAILLYGHSHGTLPGHSQRLDVGMDCWGFTPVRFDDVLKRLETLPPHVQADGHKNREDDDE